MYLPKESIPFLFAGYHFSPCICRTPLYWSQGHYVEPKTCFSTSGHATGEIKCPATVHAAIEDGFCSSGDETGKNEFSPCICTAGKNKFSAPGDAADKTEFRPSGDAANQIRFCSYCHAAKPKTCCSPSVNAKTEACSCATCNAGEPALGTEIHRSQS